MNVPLNLAKSSILATVIFWLIGMTEHFNFEMLGFVFISYIPIFMSCSFVICLTICPFFWLKEKEAFDKKMVFKTYFPYYSIVCFGICVFGIISSDSIILTAFFISVYITTSQSWIWFAQEPNR